MHRETSQEERVFPEQKSSGNRATPETMTLTDEKLKDEQEGHRINRHGQETTMG